MSKRSRQIVKFILDLVTDKGGFIFWFFIRFISALFPMVSIYLYSHVISLLEQKASFHLILLQVIIVLIVYLLDNFTRLLSIHKLQHLIGDIEFAIHRYMTIGLEAETSQERHASIQAIRNFGEAVRGTLELIRQPGIDSLVMVISIPLILLFLDFRVFVLEIAYILIYSFTDIYTTHRYVHLKDIQDSRTESYYAALQDSNDIELESQAYSRHYNRLCRWGFIEWFSLQNIAVTFFAITLLYQIYLVSDGQHQISDLVLVMGYISQTQVFLNNFSIIKDRLADTQVALARLAKSKAISAIDLDDLI